MLSNAYFLAKIRFDTAEDEPGQKFAKFANFAITPAHPRCRSPTRYNSPVRHAPAPERDLQENQQARVHQKLLQDFVTLKREFADLKKSMSEE